ncbi:MAG: GAF domain-containing protein [Gemmataceae bacterium]|nr:GAF domain-containing protein [Gemmataceae bacterium]
MTGPTTPEPSRPADLARLALTRLRVEDGVTLGEVFRRLTEAAAEVLGVERVGVWLLVDGRRALRCIDLFERSKGIHSAGATLRVADFPDYFAAMERRKTLPAEVAVSDPRTTGLGEAYLDPLGIGSLLNAPIYVGGEVVGAVCHEHVGPPREWTTEERDFAGSMADLAALKMRASEMAEARAALRTQESQLAEARRLDALAEMAGGAAHDFNNVLTVVNGAADLIASDPTAGPTVVDLAGQIAAAGKRGAELARELMSFARPGPAAARVTRPAEVIQAQLLLLQAAAGPAHPVELDIRSTAGRVLIAPDQLERAVLNLVINARDAVPAGGPIAVAVDAVEAGDEDGRPGRFVLVEVRDTGTGIPADVLPRIFDPFFTTKPRGQGTGLGLAVVSRIVAFAGGFVRVETEVGKGTAFRLYLPRVASQG